MMCAVTITMLDGGLYLGKKARTKTYFDNLANSFRFRHRTPILDMTLTEDGSGRKSSGLEPFRRTVHLYMSFYDIEHRDHRHGPSRTDRNGRVDSLPVLLAEQTEGGQSILRGIAIVCWGKI